MEERKWDELNRDVLVEILSRVGIVSLVEYVPFVCKSWNDATLDPRCWRNLVFSRRRRGGFLSTNYMKSVVDRSQNSATFLKYPSKCSRESLDYMADQCPSIKTLYLSGKIFKHRNVSETRYILDCLSQCIGKWKNLEILQMEGFGCWLDILSAINQHCKNFVGLDCTSFFVSHHHASVLIDLVPNIKNLTLKSCYIRREVILLILKGCKELELLHVIDCAGFDPDTDIFLLSSHIKNFSYRGSSFYGYDSSFFFRVVWNT